MSFPLRLIEKLAGQYSQIMLSFLIASLLLVNGKLLYEGDFLLQSYLPLQIWRGMFIEYSCLIVIIISEPLLDETPTYYHPDVGANVDKLLINGPTR